MYVTIVNILRKPGFSEAYLNATQRYHQALVLENGNLPFDILQQGDAPECSVFYEASTTTDFAAANKLTPHYLIWRDSVANWMSRLRLGTVYHDLFSRSQMSA